MSDITKLLIHWWSCPDCNADLWRIMNIVTWQSLNSNDENLFVNSTVQSGLILTVICWHKMCNISYVTYVIIGGKVHFLKLQVLVFDSFRIDWCRLWICLSNIFTSFFFCIWKLGANRSFGVNIFYSVYTLIMYRNIGSSFSNSFLAALKHWPWFTF